MLAKLQRNPSRFLCASVPLWFNPLCLQHSAFNLQPSAFFAEEAGQPHPHPNAKNPNPARNPRRAPLRGHTKKILYTFPAEYCCRCARRFPPYHLLTFSRIARCHPNPRKTGGPSFPQSKTQNRKPKISPNAPRAIPAPPVEPAAHAGVPPHDADFTAYGDSETPFWVVMPTSPI